jgi:hypothetical protein
MNQSLRATGYALASGKAFGLALYGTAEAVPLSKAEQCRIGFNENEWGLDSVCGYWFGEC